MPRKYPCSACNMHVLFPIELDTMLATFSSYFKDVSLLRRFLFAVSQLPSDLPGVWEQAIKFAGNGKDNPSIDAKTAQLLSENLQELDSRAFASDQDLLTELIQFPRHKPLGIILMPKNNECTLCGSKLQLRKDKPSSVVIYDDSMGTLPASHFHKVCKNRACGSTQYYGYYTTKNGESAHEVFYNQWWQSLPYFVTSCETGFSMSAMHRFAAEILLGQLSFKQCADIYNHLHNWRAHVVPLDDQR